MRVSALFASVSAVVAFSACGEKGSSGPQMVDLPISVEQVGSPAALNLSGSSISLMGTGISDYKMEVTGCKSGYTKTVVSTAAAPEPRVALYKYDVDCKAGLLEFSLGGKLYTKVGGGSLSTGSAIFTDGSLLLSVSVASQFDSPLTSAGKAEFKFYEIRVGADHSPVAANYSEGHDMRISGVEAPNFEISQVLLSGIGVTDGAPTFQVKLECQKSMVGGACPSVGGDNQDVASMDMKLVEDTYGGTLTYQQAEALFTTAGTKGTVDATAGTHGGMSADLVGPAPLYGKRNTLVVIRYSDGGGAAFRYFNLDIGEPTL